MSTSEWDDEVETHVARTPRESREALTLLAPNGPITIEGNETLGSAPDVTVRIVHPTVSRLHARLEVDGRNATWIVDLDSTNGTFVDGLRVRAAALHPGAAIRLGDVELRAGSSTTTSTRALWPEEAFGALLGRSKSMRSLFERLAKAAASEATVLVQGETGVGKELVARALHSASSRAKGPFVVVDCGAIPEALFESELFGHVRGAFTGADRPRDGAVDAAQGGTLFMDEIGELPLSVQPKVLRMLESKTVRRVGESVQRPVDVRVVCATHRDLSRMVAVGSFREDLWFRVAVLLLSVPPLRERREDIPLLVERFAQGRALDAALVQEMSGMPWSGNARELRNHVERVLTFGRDETPRVEEHKKSGNESSRDSLEQPYREAREELLEALEKRYLVGLLERERWNVTSVAERMEMTRTHIHRLMKKHALTR